jgi:hypothetical protein
VKKNATKTAITGGVKEGMALWFVKVVVKYRVMAE